MPHKQKIKQLLAYVLTAVVGVMGAGLTQSASPASSLGSTYTDRGEECAYDYDDDKWSCTYKKDWECNLYDTNGDGKADECGHHS